MNIISNIYIITIGILFFLSSNTHATELRIKTLKPLDQIKVIFDTPNSEISSICKPIPDQVYSIKAGIYGFERLYYQYHVGPSEIYEVKLNILSGNENVYELTIDPAQNKVYMGLLGSTATKEIEVKLADFDTLSTSCRRNSTEEVQDTIFEAVYKQKYHTR